MRDFVEWCEMMGTAIQSLNILNEVMEVVGSYKYPGVHTDSRLNWKTNIDAVYKKRRADSTMLDIFHQPVVASAPFYAGVCQRAKNQSQRHQYTNI